MKKKVVKLFAAGIPTRKGLLTYCPLCHRWHTYQCEGHYVPLCEARHFLFPNFKHIVFVQKLRPCELRKIKEVYCDARN